MFHTKLIRLLKHLDKKELVQLGHFLDSPFFFRGRKEQRLIEFYDYLKRYYPDFNQKKVAKEAVFESLFAGKTYNERQLQQLMTKFTKAIERFIIQTYQTKTFGFPPDFLGLSAFYREKNLLPYFEKLHQSETNRLAKKDSKDTYHYWVDFLLAKDLTEQQSLFNTRQSDLNLPQTLSRLDYFFIAAQLESACVLLDQQLHQVPLTLDGALSTIQALQPLLDRGHYRDAPLIDLLYRAYLLLQKDAPPQAFHELEEAFDQNAMQIGFNQRQIIHAILRNFSTKKLNRGEEAYLEPLFNLYQKGLSRGVLTFSGGLLPATFRSIATLGIRLKEFAWVENFLEEYRHQLVRAEEPESIYMLARASLLFAKGAYEEVLNCLTYEFADVYLKLSARRLEVQTYYELDSDLLDAKIQAFKVFIFRVSQSRLTDVHREGYNNFVDMLKQIIHPSTLYNTNRQQMLSEKIRAKQSVAERKWLLEKLEEF